LRKLSDHEILADLILEQSSLAKQYGDAALECPHADVRNEMLGVMNEEHRLHAAVFSEMEKRGLCEQHKAPSERIDQIREKFKEVIP